MMRRIRRGDTTYDFVGRMRTWLLISGAIILVSVASLAIRKVNAGIEFRGGTAFQVESAGGDVEVPDVRGALDGADVGEAKIQQVGDRGFLVETEHLSTKAQQKAVQAMADVFGVESSEVNVTDVGPKWGAQITSKAVRALIIFLFVVAFYLAIRLEWKMAGAGMIALVHDMIITAGVYSLSGFEVTPSTVIAFLTILGYSLYDTVVIFDRVKDRTSGLSAAGRVTYSQATNEALNQVLLRSLNTTVVSLLPVGSLLFVGSVLLGAQTLRELALALFIGLAAGAYSSVFIATPILAAWKEREPRWSTLRSRLAARSSEATSLAFEAPTQTPLPVEAAVGPSAAIGSSTVGGSNVSAKPKRPKGHAPGRRKKKKRRR